MSLESFWFLVIAIVWCGFFVLEGFDFGVGMLHRLLSRNDAEARVAVNSIGPWWDGNEVWLIVGGAAVFAAFPAWYATWFSAGYLALLLVLAALIIRGVAFEYRQKVDDHRWRGLWSGCLTLGSALVPLVLGVALGDLVAGLPIDDQQQFTGDFWDLFTPYGVVVGVTLLVLCLLHGATFLSIRTTDGLRQRSGALAARLAPLVALVLVVFALATDGASDADLWRSYLLPAVAVLAVLIGGWSVRHGAEVRAFLATGVAMAATVGTVFLNLYPNTMVSSTAAANNLTVADTASGHYALQVMTVVVVIFLPVVLLYQGWSFRVFRHRVATPPGEAPAPHVFEAASSD